MENTIEIIKDEIPTIVDFANHLEITPQNIDETNRWIRETILDSIQKVKEFFGPQKDAAYNAHKIICRQEKKFLEPLEKAEKISRNKISYFLENERSRHEEEERKLRERAEREAEKERQKILKQATKAEARGNDERVADLLNKAEMVQPIAVSVIPRKIEGLKEREEWVFEIKDEKLIPDHFWIKTLDISALKILAVNSNGSANIPGIVLKKKIVPVFERA